MAAAPDDITGLTARLRGIDGRNYGAYKTLAGVWRLDNCDLRIDHVQGDPFASPSRVTLLVDARTAVLPDWAVSTPRRRVSTADFLLRRLVIVARDLSRHRGSGGSGVISVIQPGQEVLERSAMIVRADGRVEARVRIGLPASGRRVLSREALALLLDDLLDLVEHALRADTLDQGALRRQVYSVEDQQALRDQLEARGLVAFVADGAILPRHSGVDPRPMSGDVVAFTAPATLAVVLETPHAGPLRGMGLREGLSLIVGGGYHGKSTLLRALELGVYDHIPGDGRAAVVARGDAVKVRAEDGRAVSALDISLFIGELPGGIDTRTFTTRDASGSTSQAAAIEEARAVGCQLLLIDEDTSATNLLVRDDVMAALVGADKEPITPLVSRIAHLRESGCSLIVVIGGTSDYFSQADTVVWMDQWRAVDATGAAHALVDAAPAQAAASVRTARAQPPRERATPWRLPADAIDLHDDKGRLRVRADDVRRLDLGRGEVDLRAIGQLVAPGQALAAGLALGLVRAALAAGAVDVRAAVETAAQRLNADGLDALSATPRGDLVRPRRYEIAAILGRLRA